VTDSNEQLLFAPYIESSWEQDMDVVRVAL